MDQERKIIQITAASPGWHSRFTTKGEDDLLCPVALWALYIEDGVTAVSPISAADCLELDDEADNFAGIEYIAPEAA